MRKLPKKFLTLSTAAVMAFCALSLSACGTSFTPLEGDYSGEVSSNGGFVVEKGSYFYFINGIDTYTSDNTYGTPVKGALMRIAKTDLAAKKNTAEIVVPSLMVAADYTSGIYIYGDRVYYATPNNVKNTSGQVENSYLDFKSAKLDGSDIRSYFNVSDNATVYRFVEVDGVVYLLYTENSNLHSYNTADNTDTVLAESVSSYLLNSTDKTDPYFYYTMSVTADIDIADGSSVREYNQIYRVRADVTEDTAAYEYTFDEDYVDENGVPYVNLGTIVLDGIGANYTEAPTQFTYDLTDGVTPISPSGYTYSLLSYTNGGIYFTRTDLVSTSSQGDTGWLYYLSADKLGSSWNSISGNETENLATIAQNTTYASSSAIFYVKEGVHHYLYIDGDNLFRADVETDGSGVAQTTLVARGVSGATLVSIDDSSDSTYDYVYYTNSGTTGNTVERAVYNGTEEDYKILNYNDNEPYQPVRVLEVEHASSWYGYEIIDGTLFYADTTALSSTSYNYIACVDLKNADGTLMNNVEISALNAKYEEIVGGDEDGYLDELDTNSYANLSDAVEYYFYMGNDGLFYRDNDDYTLTEDGYVEYESTLFYGNIQTAIDAGKKTTYLYSEEEQSLFQAYVEGTPYTTKGEESESTLLVDEKGVSYRTYSYFVTRIGQMTDDDKESIESYWTTYLQSYTVTEEEFEMPAWGWALIGVGIGLVLVGIGFAVYFFVFAKRKKAEDEEEEEPMFVDTSDDKDVDVYADDEEAAEEVLEEPAEEPAEELAEEPAEGGSDEE